MAAGLQKAFTVFRKPRPSRGPKGLLQGGPDTHAHQCPGIRANSNNHLWRWWLPLVAAVFLLGCGGSDGDTPSGLCIAGRLMAAAGNATDGDINDPEADYLPNDGFQQAQPLSNPVYLGGYVNVAGSGPDGRSKNSGDLDDFFVADLEGAETIRLALPGGSSANGAMIDLKLFAFDDTSAPVDSALNITTTACLKVGRAGRYYLQVHAAAGAAIYHLIIGKSGLTATGNRHSEKPDFVPGQVLVRLKSSPAMAKGRSLLGTLAAKTTEYSPGRFLLQFEGARQMDTALRSLAAENRLRIMDFSRQAVSKAATMELVRRLRLNPEIAWAEPNYIRRALLEPNDPYFALQWNLDLINLDRAWDQSTGNPDVVVAVIDSGIVSSHPDLADKIVAGYDFISSVANAGDGDGPDDDPEDTGQASPPFHGTHVAGIIGASFDNGIGISGAGGDTKIMPVRVLGKNGATDADLVRAILFAAGLNPISDGSGSTLPARPADIINLSLGGPSASRALQDALDQARAAGVIIISASGNDGSDAPSFPAAANGVVSVAGVDVMGRQGRYSNFGPSIDLAAPGGDLTTDLNRDGYADAIPSTLAVKTSNAITATYGFYEGTSMAAAHVSGVAALMKAVRPSLTPDQFDAYLAGGTLTCDAGSPGRDDIYGYGILDAARAVEAAGSDPPTVLLASPPVLIMEAGQSLATLFVRSIGSGDAAVDNVLSDKSWLEVIPDNIDADGCGSYLVSVDRSGLSGGIHTATIGFRTAAANDPLTIQAAVDVLPDPAANTGHLYLLVRNSSDTETVAEAELDPENGVYNFNFSSLAAGSYILMAGTDLDNDGTINEMGEAVGGYGSIFSPEPIEPDATTSNINFSVGFNRRPFNRLAFSATKERHPRR